MGGWDGCDDSGGDGSGAGWGQRPHHGAGSFPRTGRASQDMFLVIISLLIFIAVAILVLSKFNLVKTRTTLAVLGVFVTALGIMSGWGWGMIFGMPFTPLQRESRSSQVPKGPGAGGPVALRARSVEASGKRLSRTSCRCRSSPPQSCRRLSSLAWASTSSVSPPFGRKERSFCSRAQAVGGVVRGPGARSRLTPHPPLFARGHTCARAQSSWSSRTTSLCSASRGSRRPRPSASS